MKTVSFIGSDKNAGKTTVLKFLYQNYKKRSEQICLTSIGINGEGIDAYDGLPKPKIKILAGDYFVTAYEHLRCHLGAYRIHKVLGPPQFKKTYILAECLDSREIVLEGPNEKDAVLELKKKISPFIRNLFIDGSIDRQFLAFNEISDEIYLSLLISSRLEQQKKLESFARSLNFPIYVRKDVIINFNQNFKTQLFLDSGECVYQSLQYPFMDDDLKKALVNFQKQKINLYIHGALTSSLYKFLAPLRDLKIILHNFVFYQHISLRHDEILFRPEIFLFETPSIKAIFLKEESQCRLSLPSHIPVYNLFQEDSYEITL